MQQRVRDQDGAPRKRIPGLGWLPNSVRNHFIAMLGEFVGTFMFLFFAFSATQVANTGPGATAVPQGANTSALLYVSLAFGFSLAVNAWTFFRISGGLFNPAVTKIHFRRCLLGNIDPAIGYLWHVPYRQPHLDQMLVTYLYADSWCYRSSSSSHGTLSRGP